MKNILVLDTEMNWLSSAREALVCKGYNVVTLPGTGMLNDYLLLQIPDLVILYVKKMSNKIKRIIKLLTSSRDYHAIPVLFMQQSTFPVKEFLIPNVNECISGSFTMSVLLMKVEKMLLHTISTK